MAAVVAVVMFPVASRAASAAGAPAATSASEPQQVVVTAREPALEEKSYRDILAAVTEFEHYHAAHPDAELRFHIFQRKEGIDMSQLRAWIQDPEDGTRVPIALAPDGSFTVPVVPKMRDDDALVRTDMPDGTLAWLVEISRAGDDERRHVLGDLREQCRLDVSYAHLGRAIKPPALRIEEAVVHNICEQRGVGWGTYGAKPVFSVHLAAGDRRAIELSDTLHCKLALALFIPLTDACYVLRDRVYGTPLNDASWPDDTRVDVVYVDDVDPPAVAPVATSNANANANNSPNNSANNSAPSAATP